MSADLLLPPHWLAVPMTVLTLRINATTLARPPEYSMSKGNSIRPAEKWRFRTLHFPMMVTRRSGRKSRGAICAAAKQIARFVSATEAGG